MYPGIEFQELNYLSSAVKTSSLIESESGHRDIRFTTNLCLPQKEAMKNASIFRKKLKDK